MAVHLVPTPIPPDLKRAVEDIADGVQSGHIVGLGVVVMLKGRRFFVDAFGSLVRDPHAARGYIASLDDCLRAMGEHKDSNPTI